MTPNELRALVVSSSAEDRETLWNLMPQLALLCAEMGEAAAFMVKNKPSLTEQHPLRLALASLEALEKP